MKARIQDGGVVPDVSRREIMTINAAVDEAMDLRMPAAIAALCESDETFRDHFREWLRFSFGRFSSQMQWNYRRAMESAIEQTTTLMNDPKRYERQKERRKNEKARLDAMHRESQERVKEHQEAIAEMIDNGQLKKMPWLKWRGEQPEEES